MNPLYAIGIIETIKLLSQSTVARSLKNKIGFDEDFSLHTKIDSLEARMWELEQMIHKLCEIERKQNEKHDF